MSHRLFYVRFISYTIALAFVILRTHSPCFPVLQLTWSIRMWGFSGTWSWTSGIVVDRKHLWKTILHRRGTIFSGMSQCWYTYVPYDGLAMLCRVLLVACSHVRCVQCNVDARTYRTIASSPLHLCLCLSGCTNPTFPLHAYLCTNSDDSHLFAFKLNE